MYIYTAEWLTEIVTPRFSAKALQLGLVAVGQLLFSWPTSPSGNFMLGYKRASCPHLQQWAFESLCLVSYPYSTIYHNMLAISAQWCQNGVKTRRNHCTNALSLPTPQHFLITASCLSFYGLIKSVSNGNAKPGELTSLLEPDGAGPSKQSRQDLNKKPIEDGDLTGAEQHKDLSNVTPDHGPCIVTKCDAQEIFYSCGYVARKSGYVARKESVELGAADYTRLKDKGSLLYPHSYLFLYVC